ncbi:D-methionine transport system substrate-binding protein [Pelagirhabdus alkalitolerans]|uniref:D-methionine transport system substrate-binding protein n=1 Tax=Pelagirhabdus alkalitolerans TaxID=1612202 RepID=A0A1G6IZJ8_9BACI|nr:MetQ/NlpA family ABC transporter substrate-binding protein [Pelagirhabdus alkalitolerans]SDC11860.1 D-methionine transport system substrate-binding protein [Pelagirhabdus alkalitolerans]
MKKKLFALLLVAVAILAACSGEEETETITVGFGVGTYEEQFREGILPILEEQGYEVDIEVFSQNMQVNPAMDEGAIDASVFQSTAYMEGINEELGIEMERLAFAPGAPQSLHSENHDSLDAVEDGTTVALPNDPVNQERAVRILEDLGWVTVEEDAGTTDFNLNSVSPDEYEIEFEVLDPAQILVSLEDVDYGIINGNYIAEAGMRIADGLAIEDTPEEHRIIVSVLEVDLDEEWAQDLKAAYESEEFEDYITGESRYDGFVLPEAWDNN